MAYTEEQRQFIEQWDHVMQAEARIVAGRLVAASLDIGAIPLEEYEGHAGVTTVLSGKDGRSMQVRVGIRYDIQEIECPPSSSDSDTGRSSLSESSES